MLLKQILSGALVLSVLASNAYADQSSATVRVNVGNVTSIAVGDGTAAVNIGGLPAQGSKGCAKTALHRGDIVKIAISPNAKAIVQIPGDSTHCEEKTP